MYLDQNIKMNSLADAARKKYNSTDKRLEEIESNFHSKMKGRTMGGVIGSFFGTLFWAVFFIVIACYCAAHLNKTLFWITVIAAALLIVTLFIDDGLNYMYFGKIASYGSSVSQLRARVQVGRESISANTDLYMKSKSSGWNYRLERGTSISDEATAIEATMSSMDSLKNGFVNIVKNGLYYVVSILITIIGSMALFDTVSGWMYGFFGELTGDTAKAICWCALAIVCVAEYFVAKWVWSWTDCSVGNLTMLGVLAGPLLFMALVLIGSAAVALVIFVVRLVLYLIGLAVAAACVWGSLSGG